MSGQAKELSELVHSLAEVVGARQTSAPPPKNIGRRTPAQGQKRASVPGQATPVKKLASPAAARPKTEKAQDVIPFDDDEFENF